MSYPMSRRILVDVPLAQLGEAIGLPDGALVDAMWIAFDKSNNLACDLPAARIILSHESFPETPESEHLPVHEGAIRDGKLVWSKEPGRLKPAPMPESFANYPETLGERRDDTNAAKWTPREALISALRALDSGKINPDCIVVAYRETKGPGDTSSGFYNAGPDVHTSLGLLVHISARILGK